MSTAPRPCVRCGLETQSGSKREPLCKDCQSTLRGNEKARWKAPDPYWRRGKVSYKVKPSR